MWKVPLFDLNFDESEEKAVIEVLKSRWISMGEKTKEFEKKFSELISIKHAIALTNCTSGLHLAMIGFGIKEGDEVIVPSLTFVATVNAIRYVRAIPVFADIVSENNLTVSPDDIYKKITSKTRAIIVMHYGGFACDMDKIMDIADKYKLKVIEDAAHAPTATYRGEFLGTIGDIGVFSFFSNKNITTAEGGIVVTNNDKVANRIRLLRSHGMTTLSYERYKGHATTYDVVELGFNYRIDDIRSAIGISQLNKLKENLKRRRKLVKHYISGLSNIESILVPFEDYPYKSTNYIFVVVLKKYDPNVRDYVRNVLKEKYGIQTSVHYPPVHKFSIYKKFSTSLPITESVSSKLITLPLFDKMTFEQVDYVVDALKKTLKEIRSK